MNSENETIYCKNCGIEITWLPLVVKDCVYCCQDCLQHLSCQCVSLDELEEEHESLRGSMIGLIAGYSG